MYYNNVNLKNLIVKISQNHENDGDANTRLGAACVQCVHFWVFQDDADLLMSSSSNCYFVYTFCIYIVLYLEWNEWFDVFISYPSYLLQNPWIKWIHAEKSTQKFKLYVNQCNGEWRTRNVACSRNNNTWMQHFFPESQHKWP